MCDYIISETFMSLSLVYVGIISGDDFGKTKTAFCFNDRIYDALLFNYLIVSVDILFLYKKVEKLFILGVYPPLLSTSTTKTK